MKIKLAPAIAAAALAFAVTACGGQGDDALGDNVEDAAEARADQLEEMADNTSGAAAENLEAQADAVEEQGEAREEAIDEADVNVSQ